MVGESGLVENRVIETPPGLPASVLVEAGNYLGARLAGRSLEEARAGILAEIDAKRAELDVLTKKVVKAGLLAHGGPGENYFIVKGQSKLLQDVKAANDLEQIQRLLVAFGNPGSILLDCWSVSNPLRVSRFSLGRKIIFSVLPAVRSLRRLSMGKIAV